MADSRWRQLMKEERFFPLGVLVAIAAGAGLGLLTPGWANRLEQLTLGGRVEPLNVLLLAAMTLLMIRVEVETVIQVRREGQATDFYLAYVWLLRPLMTAVVCLLFLGGLPLQRNGLMLLGAAPAFSLLTPWYSLADVDSSRTAPLIALDTLVALLLYPLVLYALITLLPQWLGLTGSRIDIHLGQLVSVMVYYGAIPWLLAAGVRMWNVVFRGWWRLKSKLLPKLTSWVLMALFISAWWEFSIQGKVIAAWPWDAVRVLVAQAALASVGSGLALWMGIRLHWGYEQTAALALVAASGNWLLPTVTAVALYGSASIQTLVTLSAPMIHIPLLAGFLRLMPQLKKRYFRADDISTGPYHPTPIGRGEAPSDQPSDEKAENRLP